MSKFFFHVVDVYDMPWWLFPVGVAVLSALAVGTCVYMVYDMCYCRSARILDSDVYASI